MLSLRRARLARFSPLRLAAALLAILALLPARPLQAAHPPAGPATNLPPVANNDSLAAFSDEGYQFLYVLDNDTDPDGDALSITNVTPAAHGSTFNEFSGVDYKPFAGFSGTDAFSYTISDGNGHSATASVTVNVAPTGTANNRFAIYAGPFDSSRWTASPYGGTNGSGPASGTCNGSTGLSIEDVDLQTGGSEFFNAFDNGLTLWIDNQQFKPALPMAVTHHSLTTGPVSLSGLRVYMSYTGLPGSDTLRTLATLANVSGASIAVTATLATNVGSDAKTLIVGSSTGVTATMSAADRWLVTSDSPTNPGYIVNTHVLFGPGAPPVTPAAVFPTVFSCSFDNSVATQGVRARFHVTVPAGATRSLLFFNQAHNDIQAALTDAAAFNQNPLAMLDGLSNVELAEIVNWTIGPVSRLYLPLVER